MKNKYKIITVDIDRHNALPLLEERVNKFISENTGWVPNTAPVKLGDCLAQALVHISAVEHV